MSRAAAPVSVVIVTRDSARFISDCLASLRALERPPAEVIVVDNASGDGTPELVGSGFPEVTLLRSSGNMGFCRGNNDGIARSASPFVLALNPDTRLHARFLEELLPAFDDARVGIACGKLFRFDGRTLDSAGQKLGRSRRPVDRGYGTIDRGGYERDEVVFGACAAAALYRRTMIEDISDPGGSFFDDAFFAFYEDLDVAWRARRRGWQTVYRHRAIGWHYRGGTAERSFVKRRGLALAARGPETKFHVAKNRYLTILRNDAPGRYLRDLPFILTRDLGTLAILLLTAPGVLGRLWRERGLFGNALERRRLDDLRPRHHVPARGDT